MKRIMALALSVIFIFSLVACSCDNEEPVEVIKVSGKTYTADLTTINIAWDDGKEPSQYQKETFISAVKTWYNGSKITFADENSFSLFDTNNGTYDFYAENCQRTNNELVKELKMRGKVDVLILEDKVSFLCDFFVKGWGLYLSIDYNLEK